VRRMCATTIPSCHLPSPGTSKPALTREAAVELAVPRSDALGVLLRAVEPPLDALAVGLAAHVGLGVQNLRVRALRLRREDEHEGPLAAVRLEPIGFNIELLSISSSLMQYT
jgi:hypothetical protein